MFSLLAVILIWNPVDEATGYTVYCSKTSHVADAIVDVGTNLTWNIFPVEPWTKYYLQVAPYASDFDASYDLSEETNYIWKPSCVLRTNCITFYIQPDETLQQSYYLTAWEDTPFTGIVDIFYTENDKMFYRIVKQFTY